MNNNQYTEYRTYRTYVIVHAFCEKKHKVIKKVKNNTKIYYQK